MCGLIVSLNENVSCEKGQKAILKRGPDQTRKTIGNGYQFYFNRLAIMDVHETGMQPFLYDGCILVANAEIYNEQSLKKEIRSYTFKSKSDCEVLLPLYRMLGVSMFTRLDGEFSIVLFDEKTNQVVAARDPIGIRPLFYGFDKKNQSICFASEAKAILDQVDQVYPFPPGHYYMNNTFYSFSSLFDEHVFHDHFDDEIFKNIEEKLIEGVKKRMISDAPIGYLLSGGLDSSLVCAIAQKHSKTPLKTFSIGMQTDPIDLKYAKKVAQYLNTDHHEVFMSQKDVIDVLDEVIYALESYDITTIRASIGMFLVSKYVHEHTDIKVLLTGEVSDELFGYKYTDYAPSPLAFQNESVKRMTQLYMYDVLRADRTLAYHSLEARVPFGDLDFVDYVMRIHPSKKMNVYGMGKYLLRKAFENNYLPNDILYREKAAFSDAVGHSMVDILKAHAESIYSDLDFNKKKKLYVPMPFSKEGLLYREIFEQYYLNHGHLIKDYWMPNRTWEHCDVDDPSARFLKNYGESGK